MNGRAWVWPPRALSFNQCPELRDGRRGAGTTPLPGSPVCPVARLWPPQCFQRSQARLERRPWEWLLGGSRSVSRAPSTLEASRPLCGGGSRAEQTQTDRFRHTQKPTRPVGASLPRRHPASLWEPASLSSPPGVCGGPGVFPPTSTTHNRPPHGRQSCSGGLQLGPSLYSHCPPNTPTLVPGQGSLPPDSPGAISPWLRGPGGRVSSPHPAGGVLTGLETGPRDMSGPWGQGLLGGPEAVRAEEPQLDQSIMRGLQQSRP